MPVRVLLVFGEREIGFVAGLRALGGVGVQTADRRLPRQGFDRLLLFDGGGCQGLLLLRLEQAFLLLLVGLALSCDVVDDAVGAALFEEFAHVLLVVVHDAAKCGHQDSFELFIHDVHEWVVVEGFEHAVLPEVALVKG